MHLKRLELSGFKSFAHKSEFIFDVPIIAIVGPNGSGKSNIVESIRFVLGEQSVKSMRGKTGSDLIFKGSRDISKMSRAAVTIVFDNKDRVFHLHQNNNQRVPIDFDEVAITREVYSDGQNKYLINGNEVRMKDIHELIASVNIGSSGHHIISQGEADRYLNANVKDRRELIEEALGLKVYQYRIKESQKKLQRAEDNMRESDILRRELAPHLRFLKKQVEKLEKVKQLREDLLEQYKKYFAQEDYLIKKIEKTIDDEREQVQQEYITVNAFLDGYGTTANTESSQEELDIQNIQKQQGILTEDMSSQKQELGRIEGMIALLQKQQEKSNSEVDGYQHPGFNFDVISSFLGKILVHLNTLRSSLDISVIDSITSDIKKFIDDSSTKKTRIDNTQEIEQLEHTKREVVVIIDTISSQKASLQQSQRMLEEQLINKKNQEQESQKQYYEYLAKKKELDGRRVMIASRDESLGIRNQSRSEEYQEAKVLLGVQSIEFQVVDTQEAIAINPQNQEILRRSIERIKIRIEDIGGGSGGEISKEYQETLERDQFLEKEITDITTSIRSLNTIITELKQTLNTEFDIGIQKINDQFDKFFKLMFGGGKARLESAEIKKRRKKSDEEEFDVENTDEQESIEYGIDIEVQLPRKKVSDLDMLSGGERSLTSIALLFALSQVNPPPFLVLDETDAALDEANSKRYGDMVESLSKYSQLIVVTHNRETMSRAQTLFGVTIGRGDASTTLSLRLEDAAQYAK